MVNEGREPRAATSQPSHAPRNSGEKVKKVKVGRWANALVPADDAMVHGLPSVLHETCPARTSAKAAREQENEKCVGGLRAPWRSTEALHRSKEVGSRVKAALRQAVLEHPALLVAADGRKDFNPDEALQTEGVERARQLVAEVLGVAHPQPLGRSSSWLPHLVRAWVEAANDPDIDLAEWLIKGAPLGVREEIPRRGIFPEVEAAVANETLEEIFASVEPLSNYKSYDEAREQVDPELQRLRDAGYVEVLGSWQQVRARFGDSVVVSKLAAILKPRADGSLKVRLVIDYRRSGVNAFVKTRERVVLPRVREAIDNAVFMMKEHGGNAQLAWMVVDFKDAFHTIPVDPEDLRLQVFMTRPGVFELFNTTVFGSKASPLIWGRFGALLMRSGQALFDPVEVLLECYVDDPLILLAGDPETRRLNAAILLLWWRVLGPGLSWPKMEAGRTVDWIGTTIGFSEKDADVVKAELPQKFKDDLARDLQAARSKPRVPFGDLRRLAGKGSWAACVGPALRNFLQPLWKVVGDAERTAQAGPPMSAKAKLLRRRGHNKGDMVATCRVRTALDWLAALLSQPAATKRSVNWRVETEAPTLLVTCDASPWGLGAILSTAEGYPLAWLSSAVTAEDAARLGIKVGDCSAQAVLEALAVLVAIRAWAPVWGGAKARIHIRSDSQAALGAMRKVSSPVVAMNRVVREMSLDLAASNYNLEVMSWGHVAGSLNDWADALSRLDAPEPKEVPPQLAAFEATELPVRDDAWWLVTRGPRSVQKDMDVKQKRGDRGPRRRPARKRPGK